MPRMRILNTAEQARFEHPPVFDSAERKKNLDFQPKPNIGPDSATGFLCLRFLDSVCFIQFETFPGVVL